MKPADIGVIGMAVMGKNLALNIADHGYRVAIYNRSGAVTDAVVAESPSAGFVPQKTLAELVAALERPRRIVVMVKAVRAGGLPTSEDEDVPSKIFAPRGFIASPAEKRVLAQWKEAGLDPSPAASRGHAEVH